MRHIFKFPDIGEGLDEGTIIEWYIEKGQTVEAGESLVKMETDKVVTDIPSPRDGTIIARYGNEGETINVGDPLVEIEIEGIDGEDALKESQKIDEGDGPKIEVIEEEAAGVVGTLESAGSNAFLPASHEGIPQESSPTQKHSKKAIATPVARALAKELKTDINLVKGTGPGGRVMKEDIEKHSSVSHLLSQTQEPSTPQNPVDIKPMSQLRKTIAKNMIRSKHNAAHMSVFDEVEISNLVSVRSRLNKKLETQDIRLSYLPFILKATALALKKHPILNSEMDIEKGNIIYKNYINLGIAVDTEDGLLVPVIKNADKLSIKQISIELKTISEKARNRKITIDDMTNGTFTITSFGSIGGKFAVPVINYPQAGILGIGRINEQAVIKNNDIAIGHMLPLSLSVDHRIVDGGEVTRFLNLIMEYLSDPINLLID